MIDSKCQNALPKDATIKNGIDGELKQEWCETEVMYVLNEDKSE